MKIAILADIHGNDTALKAVLIEAHKAGVERLFILGDIVGYYYRPHHVIDLISNWTCDMIQGNHEELLRRAMNSEEEAKRIKQKYGSGIQIALEKLDNNTLVELLELPAQKTVFIDGMQFQLCHGSPRDRDEYVYPDASPEQLDEISISGTDIIFMGHTHYPFVTVRNRTLLANVGSVGQARDRGGIASWAIVNTSNASLVLKSTPYDTASLIEESQARDPHLPYLHEVLTRNSNIKV